MAFVPAGKFSIDENRVKANPEYFVATAFRGRRNYEKRETATFEDALVAAAEIYEDRPIMVYAVAGGGQAMLGIFKP
jgi:hypothetical protein